MTELNRIHCSIFTEICIIYKMHSVLPAVSGSAELRKTFEAV